MLKFSCTPQVYQDLCKKHPTFRERSENTDLAVQPPFLFAWHLLSLLSWACLKATDGLPVLQV